MRSYELAETPPLGTVKLAGDKGVKPATPPTDPMGFYSPAEKAVMGSPARQGHGEPDAGADYEDAGRQAC
jgi:hypothetical protein